MDLRQRASHLRYGKISCEKTVAESLTAIAANPNRQKIFTHVANDAALAEARALDASGAYRSAAKPLPGISFIAQEMIAIDGQPGTTGAAIDLPELMPAQGPLVKKLRDMGAVAIGKTASTEFAFSLHNLARKLPANPHYPDDACTIGGSAAAVAIANGLAGFALDADAAGTMRASAAMCGVVGFKPGTEFWSREGVFPLSRELDSIGLIAADTNDLIFILETLGLGAVPDLSTTKLRLGLSKPAFYEGLDPEVSAAMAQALETLVKKGATLTQLSIPDYDALKTFNRVANGTALVRSIGRDRLAANFAKLDPVTQLRLKPGMEAGMSDIQHLFEQRRILANRVNSNLSHIDALIMPTLTGLPVRAADLGDAEAVVDWQNRMTRNINFAGLFNMAAITIPLPGDEPIGLQLISPGGSEIRLAAVARAVEKILGSVGQ